VAGDAAVPVFDAALPLSPTLDVLIAADDRLGCRNEGLGVDQTAGPGGSERQGRLGGSSTFPSHFGERSNTGFGGGGLRPQHFRSLHPRWHPFTFPFLFVLHFLN